MDETPHKEAGVNLWLWVFVSATTALFFVGSRSSEIFKNLISDSEQPYAGWLREVPSLRYVESVIRSRRSGADAPPLPMKKAD